MSFKDIAKAIFIFISFSGVGLVSILIGGYNRVKDDWPRYKCNPSVMPFASVFGQDTMTNFTECMGDMNMGFMGFFLAPVMQILGVVASLGKAISGSLNSFRGMFSMLRFGMFGIFGDLLGVIVNLITKFQLLVINLKGMVMKIMGIVLTVQYKLESTILSGRSVWNGPMGGTLRGLGNIGS